MTYLYFKIAIADITDDIFTRSAQTSPYTMKKSADNAYGLLKFNYDDIPFQLLQLGYSPMTQDEALTELASGAW